LHQNTVGMGLKEEFFSGDIFSKGNSDIVNYQKNSFVTNLYGYLAIDNLDDYYFPNKGIDLYSEYSLQGQADNSNNFSNFFLFRMRNFFPVSKKVTVLLNVYSRTIFSTDFPVFKGTIAGGAPFSQYFDYHIPFIGLSPVNLVDRFSFSALTGFRFRFFEKHYASILVNGLYQNSDILNNGDGKMIWGGGLDYSVKTLFGPIDIIIGISNNVKAPTFSANFGFWF
jgi:NTE family protein